MPKTQRLAFCPAPACSRLCAFRRRPPHESIQPWMQGDEVTPYYDPMIAKIIVHAAARSEAIAKLAGEWRQVCVWPVKTNAGFIGRCLADADFIAGNFDTGFVAAREQALTKPPPPSVAALAEAAMRFHQLYAAPRRGAQPRSGPSPGRNLWALG